MKQVRLLSLIYLPSTQDCLINLTDPGRLYTGPLKSFLLELKPLQLFPLYLFLLSFLSQKITTSTGCPSPCVLRCPLLPQIIDSSHQTGTHILIYGSSQRPKYCNSADSGHFQHWFGLPHTKFPKPSLKVFIIGSPEHRLMSCIIGIFNICVQQMNG